MVSIPLPVMGNDKASYHNFARLLAGELLCKGCC